MDFLFSAVLWALPLAALPVAVHLLLRRRMPVVMFSTIRFLKLSAQQTAARKQVQRWVLLACRALLLAVLIGAAAQPRTRPASLWAASPRSLAAAIVVDTSYSMQLSDHGQKLLQRADAMVRQLLAGPLHDANVAIFQSSPPDPSDPANAARIAQEAGNIGSQIPWPPLVPQPAPHPLVDRIPAALEFLRRSHAADRRLIVISDFQQREFPRALPDANPARMILLDLHPSQLRSLGITGVRLDPPRPLPGVGSEVVVEVCGHSGSEPLVGLTISTPQHQVLRQFAPLAAKIDGSGYGRARFELHLPAERWLLVTAALQQSDDMPWDDARTMLLEVPARQDVWIIGGADFPQARKFIRLALDPGEGKSDSWPLAVKSGASLPADASAAVIVLDKWPDDQEARRMLRVASAGGRLILFLRPGLEVTWAALAQSTKDVMLQLLGGEPTAGAEEGPSSAGPAAANPPVLAGLADPRYQLGAIVVERFVPIAVISNTGEALLNLFALNAQTQGRPYGLLYQRDIGAGTVFTFTTIPDGRFTNLATHPVFLPLMVRMALLAAARQFSNVEVGQPITAGGPELSGFGKLWVHTPQNATYPAKPIESGGARHFEFHGTDAPGIYTWTWPDDPQPLAFSNVQPPAAESRLDYRAPQTLARPRDNVLIATSLQDLQGKIAALNEPTPRWPVLIAAVMALLCFETLMATTSGWRRREFHSVPRRR